MKLKPSKVSKGPAGEQHKIDKQEHKKRRWWRKLLPLCSWNSSTVYQHISSADILETPQQQEKPSTPVKEDASTVVASKSQDEEKRTSALKIFKSSQNQEISSTTVKDEASTSQSNDIDMVGQLPKKEKLLGPWGGIGGSPFDDGPYATVKKLVLKHGLAIDSIQIDYDKNGVLERSSRHGGHGGEFRDEIVLDYQSEVLIRISGFYGTDGFVGLGTPIIKSLTFHTTKGVYGPYGDERGKYFSSGEEPQIIVGFHGGSGLFLDRIGIYCL